MIFEDHRLTKPVESVLFEGKKYFLSLPSKNHTYISNEISRSGLTKFITWYPRNSVAVLQVVNRLGFLRIFQKVYDVRSEKFFENVSGTRQFEILLEDINNLSKDIKFDFVSATSAHRVKDEDFSNSNSELYERFSYYRNLVLGMQQSSNLDALINIIQKNFHSRHLAEFKEDYVWNSHKPTYKTFISLQGQSRSFCEINTNHPLSTASLKGFTSKDGMKLYFPLKASTQKTKLSFDTSVNQFIKYILKDIERTCNSVKLINKKSSDLKFVIEEILNKIRFLINHSFSEISELKFIPHSSPTLYSRNGYRELAKHYWEAKKPAKYLFDSIQKLHKYIDLNDVAKLYEYWVFYSVVKCLFGQTVIINSRNTIVKNGVLAQSLELESEGIKVSYNKTFTRRNGGSYSVELRPDIAIEIKTKSGPLTILLDAKYKNSLIDFSLDNNEAEGVVRTDDLHKMHCYVDAIEEAIGAIVVYPGHKVLFYPKAKNSRVIESEEEFKSFDGIGAIPLLPGNFESQKIFEKVMRNLKELSVNE